MIIGKPMENSFRNYIWNIPHKEEKNDSKAGETVDL